MNFIKKYKHGFVIVTYAILYLFIFQYLEQRHVYSYHLIHCALDDLIPFCEYFIVPYLLWFPYQVFVVAYFIFFNKNKREYYQLTLNLCMGMTVFLIVSWLYPNIQLLRPAVFADDNLFIRTVQHLYSIDTPTNILPSIHVFNSLAIHMSLTNCEALRDKKLVKAASFTLTSLIIMSTMFLKQHSVIDVCMGSTLALFGFLVFYPRKAAESSRAGYFSKAERKKSEN